jgi:hypothetical protein
MELHFYASRTIENAKAHQLYWDVPPNVTHTSTQALENNSRPCKVEWDLLVLRFRERERHHSMLYKSCTMAPTRAVTPTTADALTVKLFATLLAVPDADELEDVLLPPVVDWTSLLAALQVYAPLTTLVLRSWSKGWQLMFPELCMLNVPLQSARAGRETLWEISIFK